MWSDEASCINEPIDNFFDNYLKDPQIFEEVNSLCKSCPVKTQCLQYGKTTKSMGVWGGVWLHYGVPVDVELVILDDQELV